MKRNPPYQQNIIYYNYTNCTQDISTLGEIDQVEIERETKFVNQTQIKICNHLTTNKSTLSTRRVIFMLYLYVYTN